MPEVKIFKCNECNEKFSKAETLRDHKLINHPMSFDKNKMISLSPTLCEGVQFKFDPNDPSERRYENTIEIKLKGRNNSKNASSRRKNYSGQSNTMKSMSADFSEINNEDGQSNNENSSKCCCCSIQ